MAVASAPWFLFAGQVKIKKTFAEFDMDQNGEIDLTELRSLLGRLGEMPSEKHLQVCASDVQ